MEEHCTICGCCLQKLYHITFDGFIDCTLRCDSANIDGSSVDWLETHKNANRISLLFILEGFKIAYKWFPTSAKITTLKYLIDEYSPNYMQCLPPNSCQS